MKIDNKLIEKDTILNLIENKKYTDAYFVLNELIKKDSNADWLELKAMVCAWQSDWHQVAALLMSVMETKGELSDDFLILLVNALKMIGDLDLVDQVLKKNKKTEVNESQFMPLTQKEILFSQGNKILFNGFDRVDEELYKFKIIAPKQSTKLILDIYPSSDPRHPERHFGTWELELCNQNEYYIILNFKTRELICSSNVKIISCNIYDYFEENHYNLFLYEKVQGQLVQRDCIGQYLGAVKDIEEIQAEKIPKLKSAVWFLTWKCNFKCSYCWEVQRIIKGELQPEPYKDYKLWVNAWNRLKPQILDISGGEPFLQPNFIALLNELDPSIKIAITTNLSFDVVDFVQKVTPEKIISLTFSYHPTQKMSRDQFGGKVLLVKNRGFKNITVNYVTWPEQIWQIEEYKKYFEETIGVRFHVDPYVPTPHFPYTYSSVESEYIKQFIEPNRRHTLGVEDIFDVACSGGVNHISVEPDGSAYRCIQDKVTHQPKIGNILESDFSLREKKTFCDQYHLCPGCDRDKVDITRVNKVIKSPKKLIPIESV